jgi:hypothetical protein
MKKEKRKKKIECPSVNVNILMTVEVPIRSHLIKKDVMLLSIFQ